VKISDIVGVKCVLSTGTVPNAGDIVKWRDRAFRVNKVYDSHIVCYEDGTTSGGNTIVSIPHCDYKIAERRYTERSGDKGDKANVGDYVRLLRPVDGDIYFGSYMVDEVDDEFITVRSGNTIMDVSHGDYTVILQRAESGHEKIVRSIFESKIEDNHKGLGKLSFEVPVMHSEPWQTPKQWQPTEHDYRECCGVWRDCDETDCLSTVTPDVLEDNYDSRADFDDEYHCYVKIEPIPEQCIPRKESPRERYVTLEDNAFPTLAKYLGGF